MYRGFATRALLRTRRISPTSIARSHISDKHIIMLPRMRQIVGCQYTSLLLWSEPMEKGMHPLYKLTLSL